MLDLIIEIAIAVCVLGAGGLSIAAGVGLLRFRDPLSRLHAATKPQIFGLLLIILAVALAHRSLLSLYTLLPVFILQSLTAPVAAHMAGRAAYRADHVARDTVVLDELAPVIQLANTQVADPYQTEVSAEETAYLPRGAQSTK